MISLLHYILVKYSDAVTDPSALERDVRALFAPAAALPGVHGVSVRPAVIRAQNRHDLMIVMRMEPKALAAFDASPIHRRWKAEFGRFVAQKTIFDCDDADVNGLPV